MSPSTPDVNDTSTSIELRAPFVYRDDEALEKKFQWQQIRRLLSYLKGYPKLILAALTATFGGVTVALIAPYWVGHVINLVVARTNERILLTDGLLLMTLYVLNFSASRFRIHLTNLLGQSVIRDLRAQLFRHVQGLSQDFFDQRPAGSVLVRIMNDVNSLQDLFTNGVINSITNVFTLIGIVVIMLTLNTRLALVTLLVVPVMFLLSIRLTVQIRRAWQQVRLRLSRINAHLAESIQGIRVTEAYARQEENRQFFFTMNRDYMDKFLIAQRRSILFGPLVDFTGAFGSTLLFWYGVHLLNVGLVSVGLLVAFANYLGNFWTPIQQLGQLYNQILVAMASSERIFQYLDTKPSIPDIKEAKFLPVIRGEVRFEHVDFEYETNRKALKDISFTVSPGQTIALVGQTGAGKSTVINLLSRFYAPTVGRILVDGYDIHKITTQSLRSQIGIILQETFIFSGTILENIRYARPIATDEEVIQAAKAVHADEFIRRLEDGYQTEVRERGSRLSTGERQLISFARAVLANPKILILDEATASIDTYTERLIQKGLAVLLQGRTAFVVAHRLSTIRDAEQILVFKQGEIVERGTHAELMETQGEYYHLVSAQYRFFA